MPGHRGRDGIGPIGIQIFKPPPDNAPEPAGREFALTGRFVNWNNASDLERRGCLFLGLVGAAVFVDVAQNVELRLHDLQLAVAVLLDLAIEREHLPGLEAILKVGSVEPQALQLGAVLANRELKDWHAARAKQSRVAD